MANVEWPAGLPTFQQSGYNRGGDDGVIRSEMDSGVRKSRPIGTAPPFEQISAQIWCTAAQVKILMDFWLITLKRVKPFKYIDHISRADAVYKFTARPTVEPLGGTYFTVTMNLEIVSSDSGAYSLSNDVDGPTITTDDDKELTT